MLLQRLFYQSATEIDWTRPAEQSRFDPLAFRYIDTLMRPRRDSRCPCHTPITGGVDRSLSQG